jgi:O-antigen/teichoic acid export membrane protein
LPHLPLAQLVNEVLKHSTIRFGKFEPLTVTIGTSFLIQLVTLLSGVVLARGLGPEARGQLAVVLLWAPLLAGLGGLGVAEAVAYHASKELKGHSDALTSAMIVALPQSMALMLIGLIVLPFALAGKPAYVIQDAVIYLVVIPLNPLSLYPLAVLQGRLSFSSFNLVRLLVNVAYTAFVVILWALGSLSVFAAMAASLAATFATCGVSLYLVWAHGYVNWRPASWLFRSLLTFGLKIHVGNIAGILGTRLDILFLSFLSSAAVLGHYTVATSVASGIALVPNAVSMILYPAFSRDAPSDRPRRLSRLLLVGTALTVVVVPAAIILVWPLIPFVFGNAFRSAVPIAQLLVGGYLLRGWSAVFAAVVRGSGHPFTASVGDVLNIVAFAPLLMVLARPTFGTGAAIALTGAAAVQVAWLGIQAFRCTGLTIESMFGTWLTELKHYALQISRK